jgi:hypothetical protein
MSLAYLLSYVRVELLVRTILTTRCDVVTRPHGPRQLRHPLELWEQA